MKKRGKRTGLDRISSRVTGFQAPASTIYVFGKFSKWGLTFDSKKRKDKEIHFKLGLNLGAAICTTIIVECTSNHGTLMNHSEKILKHPSLSSLSLLSATYLRSAPTYEIKEWLMIYQMHPKSS